jgi:hypothetical protein
LKSSFSSNTCSTTPNLSKNTVSYGYPGLSNYEAANKLVVFNRPRLVWPCRCDCAVSCNANPVLTQALAIHGIYGLLQNGLSQDQS